MQSAPDTRRGQLDDGLARLSSARTTAVRQVSRRHRGRLFEIFDATLTIQGRDLPVCIKAPRARPDLSETVLWSRNDSYDKYLERVGTPLPPYRRAGLLVDEASTLLLDDRHWNHDVLGMGMWHRSWRGNNHRPEVQAQRLQARPPLRCGWSMTVMRVSGS